MASAAPLYEYNISNDVETLCENEYSLTFVQVKNVVNGIIHWNIGKYHELKNNMIYTCPIPAASTLCLPMWNFSFEKFSAFLRIGLMCHVEETNVTFSVLLGKTTSSFVITKGFERKTGKYSGEILCREIEFYNDMLSKECLILRCQVKVNDKALRRSSYPYRICSCTEFASNMELLFEKKYFSNCVIEYGEFVNEAHECIIFARCPKLHMFFKCSSDPTRLVIKEIPNHSENPYEEVLRYLYTGSTSPLTVEKAVSVFMLSNTLNLSRLKESICDFLGVRISKENFVRIAVAATVTRYERLTLWIENFLLENKEEMRKYLYLDDGETLNVPETINEDRVRDLNQLIKSTLEQRGQP